MFSSLYKKEIAARTQWFLQDRFGMFIHWGAYAVPARGEWVQSAERIPPDTYQRYVEEFNPTHFDPVQWAKTAKAAGMKYAVLTAKHHDGFCLFDSAYTDYKSTNTAFKRDVVKEYVEAFRAEGLKVGLYYSLLDWHHEDYPAYGDSFHPMRENAEYTRDPENFDRYITYMHNQIRELLTNYGEIDLMWFDFSYDEMTGEKWKASELIQMVRSIQPEVIVDNRLDASGEHGGSIMTSHPTIYSGDFASPEQLIPAEGVVDEDGHSIPWEACITLNNNWGYHSGDTKMKSSAMIIRKLVECVSKNGNLMLNVGPDAKGNIPEASLRVLQEVGEWMKLNHDSIYGAVRADIPKPDWGRYTQKGNKLYAHILEQSVGPVNLQGFAGRIKSARLLRDGSEVALVDAWNTKQYAQDAFINFGEVGWFTYDLPDSKDTVVELEMLEA